MLGERDDTCLFLGTDSHSSIMTARSSPTGPTGIGDRDPAIPNPVLTMLEGAAPMAGVFEEEGHRDQVLPPPLTHLPRCLFISRMLCGRRSEIVIERRSSRADSIFNLDM